MTANRVYRKQMDFGYVLGELEKGRGTQFDAQFVDILLKLIRDGVIDLNKLYGVTPDEAEAAQEKEKPAEQQSPGGQKENPAEQQNPGSQAEQKTEG